MGTLLGLLTLLAQAGGLISNIAKSSAQSKNDKEVKKYNKNLDRFEKEQTDKTDREQRRQALARAIGADEVYAPQPTDTKPEKPELKDLSGYDVAAGISNVVGQGAAGAQGMLGSGTNAADKAMGDLSAGVNAAGTSTYTKPATMQSQGSFDAPMGDPLSATTGNKYKRYAEQNYKYS